LILELQSMQQEILNNESKIKKHTMSRLDHLKSKIYNLETIERQLNIWRFQEKKIVFTNGCFDLLHFGHVDYLSEAADLGDVLILGLNSDDSVRKLKGPRRPVNSQKHVHLCSHHFLLSQELLYLKKKHL